MNGHTFPTLSPALFAAAAAGVAAGVAAAAGEVDGGGLSCCVLSGRQGLVSVH